MQRLVEQHGPQLAQKLKDPIFFINEIIGFDRPPYKLTPYQEEWILMMEKHDRLNLMAFRSSGKTEVMLVCYPIFKAFTVPKWEGIVVSSSLNQVSDVMRRIRDKISMNEILRTSIPDSKSTTWSKTQIELKNGSRLISRPNTDNLRGSHVDWVGGDEIGVWKDMDIITKTIPPITRAKEGSIIFIGTPMSEVDPIHQLMKNKAYISKVYPANGKFKDTTLWELRYPNTSIQKVRREYDSMSWSREFLCKPLSSDDMIFPYELVRKSFDEDAPFKLKRQEHRAYYIGLDFALSGEISSDYTVYTVLEKLDDTLRVVNIERYKGLSYQAQKARIKELSDIYKPVKVIADEGSFGKSFIQDLRCEYINIESFRFTNESKQNLITNLRNYFEQERLIINKDPTDIKTKDLTDLLVVEMSKFGITYTPTGAIKFEGKGEHDDMVISLALSCWAAKGGGSISWHIGRGGIKKSSGLKYMGRVN